MRFTYIKTVLAIVITGLFTTFSSISFAQNSGTLKLELKDGVFEPTPIAIPAFMGSDPVSQDFGSRIAAVVASDLESSGFFRLLDPRAYIEQISDFNAPPQFPDWRAINTKALVVGQALIEPDGRLRVQFRLWNILGEEHLTGQQYFVAPEGWRRAAHRVADSIYSALTGEKGYFDSRMVFVDESGPKSARVKRLAIMDQDGENVRYLTSGNDLVLTPRFSPTDQEITYISYEGGTPQVYLLDLDTGQQEILGHFPGMTFAPRFSPNGREVVLSLSQAGNTDISVMDLATRRMQRLTRNPGIDTSPSFSPDGNQIVFESDRGGSQQIYVMNSNGSGARRISFGDGRYATPVWSPRGDLIAFTKMLGGRFHIGVMRPDGSAERILTSSFLDEGPTWAPNGRVLMFFRETPGASGSAALYTVDVSGRNLRKARTPRSASDPAWSPLLQ